MKVYYAVDILSFCDDLSKRVSRPATTSMRLSVYSKIPNSLSHANPGTFFLSVLCDRSVTQSVIPHQWMARKPRQHLILTPKSSQNLEQEEQQSGGGGSADGSAGATAADGYGSDHAGGGGYGSERGAFGMLLGGSHVGEKADLPG